MQNSKVGGGVCVLHNVVDLGSALSRDKNLSLSYYVQPDPSSGSSHTYLNLLVGDNVLCKSAKNKKEKKK